MTKKNTLFDKLLSSKDIEENELKHPQYNKSIRLLIILFTLISCTFFFSIHFNERANETILSNVVPGYIWPKQTLKANYTFSIFKDEYSYQKEVKDALDKSPYYYDLLNTYTLSIKSIIDSAVKDFSSDFKSNEISQTKRNKQADLIRLREKNIDINNLRNILYKLANDIYKFGYINNNLDAVKNDEIYIRIDELNDKIVPKSSLYDNNKFNNYVENYLKSKFKDDNLKSIIKIANNILKPNLIFNSKLTEQYKEIAKQSVPKTLGIVRQGEIIIAKGQKATDEIIRKLVSYEYTKQMNEVPKYDLLTIVGSFGHSAILYSILFFYLYFLRKRIYHSNFSFGLLSFILVFSAFLGWLSIEIPTRFPIEYLAILPGLSMLVAILYDSRTAFYSIVSMSIILAGIRGNDYDVGTAMLFSGTLAAFTVRDIQSRTQMFRSIFFIFIGFIVSIISFGLERSMEFMQIVYKLVFALVNSAISPLVTYAMIFFIEKISNLTTDLKLQEYSNLNHKLLQSMNELAPGTYQHTITVSILAEKCANAIEANALLAKVGAYFHDIGKIAKPEYFVENQINIDNKHDLLTPQKSAQAIRNHVIEGIKLAKEYKLPQRIIDFIPMHHGTSLIKHFYAKALEEANGNTVDESDFRYFGPKPNNKETAILMICDSAEALSRLENKTYNELNEILTKNINEKWLDGQFSDCNITSKEIEIIKETCLRHFQGMGHKRKEYLEIPKKQ